MSTVFPTTLDSFTNPSATDDTSLVSHAGQHANANDAILALETKVGADGSAVSTTLDYKLKNTSSVDPGHKHTFTSLSDFAVSSPTNGQVLSYNSGTSKWVNSTVSAGDATTSTKGSVLMSYAPVTAASPIAVGDNDPRVPTQGENDALVGTSGTPSSSNKFVTNDDTGTSGANKVLRLNGSGALPALDGSNLTGVAVRKYSNVSQPSGANATIVTTSIAANTLAVGSVLRVVCNYSMSHTTSTVNTLTINYGGTAIGQTGVPSGSSTSTYTGTLVIELLVLTSTTCSIMSITGGSSGGAATSVTAASIAIPAVTSAQNLTVVSAGAGETYTITGLFYEVK